MDEKAADIAGMRGEFTDALGRVCQCVVTGYERGIYVIRYVHPEDGKVVERARIKVSSFRPDCEG